jgi:hypothetical protein
MEAYYWDNLRMAMKLADDAGLGLNAAYLSVFRMIDAEYTTREASVLVDRGDWLLVEHVPHTHEVSLTEIETLVRTGCDQVADAFSWQHGPAVLFTVLHPDVNAPYVPGRHGFFIDKYPFDKVCLPTYLLDEPGHFVAAVRHEYAHAMCLNRSLGKCPTWLHEAIATVAETPTASRFGRPRIWRDPRDLEAAFRDDRETEEGAASVTAAYAQARRLGQALLDEGGTAKLGKLLDAFTDNTFLQNLIISALSQHPEDEALKQVYGFGVKELFKRAAH